MSEISRAERQRRAREWLRIEIENSRMSRAFEHGAASLSVSRVADLPALIAVGEFAGVRSLLPQVDDVPAFLRTFGAYFAASGDDAFARAVWPRIIASIDAVVTPLDAVTFTALASAAEALGDHARANALRHSGRSAVDADVPQDALTSFVYNDLGYQPDATKGRLVLRPAINPAWTRFAARNIHLGDALIDLAFMRTEDSMTFEIVQMTGAYPVRLIFEPVLSAAVSAARVDGVPATLDFRPHGDRIIVPVQIMLDDRRTITFER